MSVCVGGGGWVRTKEWRLCTSLAQSVHLCVWLSLNARATSPEDGALATPLLAHLAAATPSHHPLRFPPRSGWLPLRSGGGGGGEGRGKGKPRDDDGQTLIHTRAPAHQHRRTTHIDKHSRIDKEKKRRREGKRRRRIRKPSKLNAPRQTTTTALADE